MQASNCKVLEQKCVNTYTESKYHTLVRNITRSRRMGSPKERKLKPSLVGMKHLIRVLRCHARLQNIRIRDALRHLVNATDNNKSHT